jgi:hypothetical protein
MRQVYSNLVLDDLKFREKCLFPLASSPPPDSKVSLQSQRPGYWAQGLKDSMTDSDSITEHREVFWAPEMKALRSFSFT